MSLEFDYYSLGNLVKIKYGKNQKKVQDDENGKYPIFGTGGLMGYSIEYLYDKPSVLIGRKGSIEKVRYIEEPFWTVDTLFYTEVNEKIVIPKFLYYVMSLIDLSRYNEGTSIPSLRTETLNRLDLPIPDLDSQNRVLSILSKIDKKIEINEKINKNLAGVILSNFRRWFVNFEPFKNKPFIDSDFGFIPENWKVGSIGDYCKLKSGFAFKSAWWQDEGVKVIKIKDINQDSLDLSDCSCVSSDKLQKAKEFKVIGGDLLIAMTGATIGKFSIVPKYDESLYVNQRVGKFFLGDEPLDRLPFIWSLLKQKRIFDEIINRGQGSAQPNISPTDIETIEIILPPIEIINQFNNECKNMFKLMINNSYEITKLNKLRDTLLPKLMSGEIDVSKINCDLE
ncbi:MAG: restriction endonuclease subunit S [Methanobrevibacter sp.]|nr:restriction endonuclease subunit S [Methanobrevibacter sp.]